MTLTDIEAIIQQQTGRQKAAVQHFTDVQAELIEKQAESIFAEEAQQIIQLVAQKTQEQVTVHVSNIKVRVIPLKMVLMLEVIIIFAMILLILKLELILLAVGHLLIMEVLGLVTGL